MKTKNLIVCFIIFSVILSVSSTARADLTQPTGELHMPWLSYTGTTSAVNVDLGQGPVSTGEIEFGLVESYGPDNYLLVDWDNATMTNRMRVLADCPLMQSLNVDPFEIMVDETGTLDSIPWVDPDAYAVVETHATLSFDTTISGGVFDGFEYSNCDNLKLRIVISPGMLMLGLDATTKNKGTITPPGLPPEDTEGEGRGILVPAPGSLTLALIGLGYTSWRVRRRKALR